MRAIMLGLGFGLITAGAANNLWDAALIFIGLMVLERVYPWGERE